MPQMHFYVSDQTANVIRRRAAAAGLSVSRFLAKLVEREFENREWPEGYFDRVFGGWEGEPLTRPPQGAPEERQAW